MTELQYLSPSVKAHYIQLHCSVWNHTDRRELRYSLAVPSAFSAPEERRNRRKFKSQPRLRRQACSRSDVMYRPMNFEVASQLLNIAASHMKFTNFSASDQQQQRAQKTQKSPAPQGTAITKLTDSYWDSLLHISPQWQWREAARHH